MIKPVAPCFRKPGSELHQLMFLGFLANAQTSADTKKSPDTDLKNNGVSAEATIDNAPLYDAPPLEGVSKASSTMPPVEDSNAADKTKFRRIAPLC